MFRSLALFLISLSLTGAGKADEAAARKQANDLAAALRGDQTIDAAANPLCKFFSFAEASDYIGAPVTQAINAAMGTGCQWRVGDFGQEGAMMLQVVPQRYFQNMGTWKGYEKLPNIGATAYVGPGLDGFDAGVLDGGQGVLVSVSGPKGSKAEAAKLLEDTLKRRHK